ncbi:uncharacterized protein AB675_877 [Cyphellophora attinorum]|uniref:Uncharacterized protein n=1 Tax=Cyphellophora attinorum TaxID=1664694 RepID=A0A0N1P3T4_9EURO|nr:uncharacterized protein AB675_877 [Phialophora attinorum]KPI45780.1 hypothetical protein AB675_877 [Phialophora attinorum]
MYANVLNKGLFACCPPSLTHPDGSPVNIEVSAVAWNSKRLVFGSDKPIPGAQHSPVFSYYTAELIKSGEKYEDFALAEGGRHMIATTGFDRVSDRDGQKDRWNRLLVWPCSVPERVQLVEKCVRDGVPSSVQLREQFSAVLGGAPYFKVEGLASVPGVEGSGDPLLLFGVREVGKDHENFQYVAKIVGVPYRIGPDDSMTLTGDFEVMYEFDPMQAKEVRFQVGLSSLEWDPMGRRLHLLTSFEVEGENGGNTVGAYLWSLSLEDLHAGRKPQLIMDKQKGCAFEFQNKAEGIAVLPGGVLFIAYDPDSSLELPDQTKEKRQKNEAPYTLLELLE